MSGDMALPADRAVVPSASSPAVSPVPASIPSAVTLTEAECEALIGIPNALRRERGWSGARSVGMSRLIEERIYSQISAILERAIR